MNRRNLTSGVLVTCVLTMCSLSFQGVVHLYETIPSQNKRDTLTLWYSHFCSYGIGSGCILACQNTCWEIHVLPTVKACQLTNVRLHITSGKRKDNETHVSTGLDCFSAFDLTLCTSVSIKSMACSRRSGMHPSRYVPSPIPHQSTTV